MFSRIHFLHEILLNLLISCRENKVSYRVFLLLLLVHEVYIENQEPRVDQSDCSIQTNYALNLHIQCLTNPEFTSEKDSSLARGRAGLYRDSKFKMRACVRCAVRAKLSTHAHN